MSDIDTVREALQTALDGNVSPGVFDSELKDALTALQSIETELHERKMRIGELFLDRETALQENKRLREAVRDLSFDISDLRVTKKRTKAEIRHAALIATIAGENR